TSRLLEERPINLELLGDPAAGKNATIDAALALIPREGVYEFTASSPTALVYTEEDFQHRVVIFKEADSIPDWVWAASGVRALGGERRVIVPFGWVLGRAMSTCPLELRTRRDFEALLACVRTIAFLHQRRRQRAPGGEIEAMIDDYGAARALLIGSFFAAEAESLPAAIRELVRAIGDKEEITRTHLRERVSRPRSTFYYQVDKAIELRLLNEKKRGGRCVLTRNRDVPLPEKRPPLPEVEMVEGLIFGVPAPIGDDWFDRFISDFQNFGGPD